MSQIKHYIIWMDLHLAASDVKAISSREDQQYVLINAVYWLFFSRHIESISNRKLQNNSIYHQQTNAMHFKQH